MSTCRHWSCGFSTMTVSIIENGAGSVDVSARPALPSTRLDFGKLLDDAVLRLQQPLRLGRRRCPGSVDGM